MSSGSEEPSPADLWRLAGEQQPDNPSLRRLLYLSLLRLHGHLVDRTDENTPKHSHVTRDIKPCGSGCPACDDYHWRQRSKEIQSRD